MFNTTAPGEIGTLAAVSVCQRESDKLNNSLKLLGYQLENCQHCTISTDCDWSMRRDRLQGGTCHDRVATDSPVSRN